MRRLSDRRRCPAHTEGFTFVEILVAGAIAALAITASVIAFQSVMTHGNSFSERLDVTLDSGVLNNFYGMNGTQVSVSAAPDFSMTANAQALRERLEEDIAAASAIFCLGRNGRSAYRPSTIALPANATELNSPAAFYSHLNTLNPGGFSSSGFVSWRGASSATNASLFVLTPSANTNEAVVRAVYETDFVVTTNAPGGVYASVRRYVGGTNTDFYHVFYPGQTSTFRPLAAYFERSAVPAEGNPAVDAFKKAAERPFYFVWWPDPLERSLPSGVSSTNALPRGAYTNMAGQTSLFFVIPAFPAL